MQHLDLRNTLIAYEWEGEGGAPIVFLNGILMNMHSWQAQRAYFAERRPCLFHDFRGQLNSGKGFDERDLYIHVEDLAQLLRALRVERCHLVGTSYGGEIAMLYALKHPQQVQSLSVIASVSETDELLHTQVKLWRDLSFQPGLLYDAVMGYTYSATYIALHSELLRERRRQFQQLPQSFFSGFEALCDAFLKINVTESLPGIQCPTLVIAAENDILKPLRYSRVIAHRIPRSRLEIIPGAAHGIVIERPQEINELVGTFLEEVHKL